jgi:chemotaxis protein MotA
VDLATIIGIFGAIGFVIIAMRQDGEFGTFVNGPLILIVFCGSLFVVLVPVYFWTIFGAGK